MNHYVYKTTYPKTNEFYIGVRSCNCDPRLDKYLGSGSFISDYSKSDFRKEIIAVFVSRDMAEVFEFALISKEISSGLCRNIRVQRYNAKASLITRNKNKCS